LLLECTREVRGVRETSIERGLERAAANQCCADNRGRADVSVEAEE
jgi:hypothetical protein